MIIKKGVSFNFIDSLDFVKTVQNLEKQTQKHVGTFPIRGETLLKDFQFLNIIRGGPRGVNLEMLNKITHNMIHFWKADQTISLSQ